MLLIYHLFLAYQDSQQRQPINTRVSSGYSEDDFDGKLKKHVNNEYRLHASTIIVHNYNQEKESRSPSMTTTQTTSSLAGPSDALMHYQANRTRLPVDGIRALHARTAPMLEHELVKRDIAVRTDTKKLQLMGMLMQTLGLDR
ncbi:MAG: hypothetical protein ACKPKO_10820 [Candidatus Fonsibacter sp.]